MKIESLDLAGDVLLSVLHSQVPADKIGLEHFHQFEGNQQRNGHQLEMQAPNAEIDEVLYAGHFLVVWLVLHGEHVDVLAKDVLVLQVYLHLADARYQTYEALEGEDGLDLGVDHEFQLRVFGLALDRIHHDSSVVASVDDQSDGLACVLERGASQQHVVDRERVISLTMVFVLCPSFEALERVIGRVAVDYHV